MPLNLIPAAVTPGYVLPQSLCTSFVMTLVYPLLSISYNDGSFERSLIEDGVNPPRALRTWILAKRLTTPQLTALDNFWQNRTLGGLNPFYFYDPFGVLPGQKIGSNFDAAGNNTQGRVVCFFRGNWAQRTEMGRHTIPNLTLVEVA
jgi:hypothetical protein